MQDEDSPEAWAHTFVTLAKAYDAAGMTELAIGAYELALRVLQKDDGPELWAWIHLELGHSYLDRDEGALIHNVESAIGHLEAALLVYSQQESPLKWARVMALLGRAYVSRVAEDVEDNVETSLNRSRNALKIYTKKETPVEWARAQGNLGVAYFHRVLDDRGKNMERSIDCYESALEIVTRTVAPGEWASLQHNLGAAYGARVFGSKADNLEDSIRCYLAALEGRTRDKSPLLWALTQSNLGVVYRERIVEDRESNLRKAVDCHKAALEVRTRDATPIDWGHSRNNLGAALRDLFLEFGADNLETVVDAYTDALEVFRENEMPALSRLVARNLGEANAYLGRWTDAAAAYLIALAEAEVLLGRSLLPTSKRSELAATGGAARRAAYCLARSPEASQATLQQATVILERGRARILSDSLVGFDRTRSELTEEQRAAWDEFTRAAKAIRSVETTENLMIADSLAKGTAAWEAESPDSPSAHDVLRRQARVARAALEGAVATLRKVGMEADVVSGPTFDDITGILRPDHPLAYLLTTPWGSLILLVTLGSGGVAVERILVDEFDDKGLLDLLVGPDRDLGTPGFLHGQLGRAPLASSLSRTLRDMASRFTLPLVGRLRASGAKCVTLVASGQLGLLPFHAARDANGKGRLIDEFDVSYAPSARSLAECRRRIEQPREPFLLAIAKPGERRPLQYAVAEIEGVRRLFRGPSHPPAHRRPTKAALLEMASKASHVHFACHGRYEPYAPLESRLELAAGEVLTLGEIIARRPFADARLVVASACQTAITDFSTLPDEALGLPVGFLQGGTPGVIATLWEVDDLSTALLMIRFYAVHLGEASSEEGGSPAGALRTAQLWIANASAAQILSLIRSTADIESAVGAARDGPALLKKLEESQAAGERAAPFSDPIHWAGFVFVGA